MDIITVFLIAIGLCFDSFAVSLSCGMSRCVCTKRRGFRFAVVLAIFQGIMPLIGWLLAKRYLSTIESYDHWIAFVLLALLGGKMIKESLSSDDGCDDKSQGSNPFSFRRSTILGIATSIDALIAGVAMAMVPITILSSGTQMTNMLIATTIIAFVTLIASSTGLYIGTKSRSKIGHRAELIGGIILILIGLKVLIEHTI